MEPSKRQKQVGGQIKQDISAILGKEASGLVHGVLITVTDVQMSPDLSFAKVYVSIFPFENVEQRLKLLKDNVPLIRRELGRKVRNQLRIVPELAFYLDDSLEKITKIEQLIKQ